MGADFFWTSYSDSRMMWGMGCATQIRRAEQSGAARNPSGFVLYNSEGNVLVSDGDVAREACFARTPRRPRFDPPYMFLRN